MALLRPNAKQRERLLRQVAQYRSMLKDKRIKAADRVKLNKKLDEIEEKINDPVGFDFGLILQLLAALLPIILDLLKK